MKFKCNVCEDVVMELDEESGFHVCPECQDEITEEDALTQFEEAERVMVYESSKDDENDESDEEENDESDEEENDEKKESKMKKEEYTFEVNVDEDMKGLFDGTDLSEDFQIKVKTIFETVVKQKVSATVDTIQEQLIEQYQENLDTEKDDLTEKLDLYLDKVVEEWSEENKIAIETGIRSDIAENFMVEMKGLFEKFYIEIPEDRYDVVEGLTEQLEETKSKLDEEINKNVDLRKKVKTKSVSEVVSELGEDLADTDKERFESLVEDLEFKDSEDLEKKAGIIKETYFAVADGKTATKKDISSDAVDTKEKTNDDIVSRTMSFMKKQS